VAVDAIGRGAHRDVGRSPDPVAAAAVEPDPARDDLDRGRLGVRGHVAIAPHGEHVGERGVEFELDAQPDLARIAVQDADPLAKPVREEPRAPD